jgi:hypothetical protein
MTSRTVNRLTATVAIVVFVALSVVLASFSTRPVTDELHRRPSTFFTDPSGARALLLIMKRFTPAAEPWRRPLNFLPPPDGRDGPSTLIVADPRAPLSEREAEHLGKWLQSGGQLILLGTSGWRLRQRFSSADGTGVQDAKAPDDTAAKPAETFLAAYAPALRWNKPALFKVAEASGASVVAPGVKLRWRQSFAETGDLEVVAAAGNEALAVSIAVGQGRIVAVADPTMASNGSLRRSDNAVWLVGLAASWRNGSVFFDEYHHGFGQKRDIAELTRAFLATPWGWCLLQIAAAGLLYAFAFRRRFGRISEPPAPSRTSPLESIDARAGILQAAEARGLAAQWIAQNLCQALSKFSARDGEPPDLSRELETLARGSAGSKSAPALQAMAAKLHSASRLSDQDLIEIGRSAGEILRGQRP